MSVPAGPVPARLDLGALSRSEVVTAEQIAGAGFVALIATTDSAGIYVDACADNEVSRARLFRAIRPRLGYDPSHHIVTSEIVRRPHPVLRGSEAYEYMRIYKGEPL